MFESSAMMYMFGEGNTCCIGLISSLRTSTVYSTYCVPSMNSMCTHTLYMSIETNIYSALIINTLEVGSVAEGRG